MWNSEEHEVVIIPWIFHRALASKLETLAVRKEETHLFIERRQSLGEEGGEEDDDEDRALDLEAERILSGHYDKVKWNTKQKNFSILCSMAGWLKGIRWLWRKKGWKNILIQNVMSEGNFHNFPLSSLKLWCCRAKQTRTQKVCRCRMHTNGIQFTWQT